MTFFLKWIFSMFLCLPENSPSPQCGSNGSDLLLWQVHPPMVAWHWSGCSPASWSPEWDAHAASRLQGHSHAGICSTLLNQILCWQASICISVQIFEWYNQNLPYFWPPWWIIWVIITIKFLFNIRHYLLQNLRANSEVILSQLEANGLNIHDYDPPAIS